MRYRIEPSRISHERLGDEVIVINLEKGAYYAASGSAADLWTAITQGASVDEAVAALSDAYGVAPTEVRAEVERCVGTLVEANLIEPVTSEGATAAAHIELPASPSRSWAPPSFDEYTDMWDLIQFDPIHEVDETGWPHAGPTSKL
jgi:predicted RNase H-like HicB family nuclease